MPESEFTSLSTIEGGSNNSPWAEETENSMDVRSEIRAASAEAEKSESGLANRIKHEMTLEEISKLDIANLPDDEYAAVKERIKQYRETGNADPIEAKAPAAEVELPRGVQEMKEKATKNPGFNSFANKSAKKIELKRVLGATGLALAIGAAGFVGYEMGNAPRSDAETPNGTQVEESINDFESRTGYDILDEKIDGSFEQDGNLGCYESEGKVSDTAVGNPDLVLKEMGIDPATATAEQRGVVDEYMTYSMKYPAAGQAVAYELEGFKGLTINQAEEKIANMSDEEKAEFMKELQKIYENSEYSFVYGQGVMENLGVDEIDGVRQSFGIEQDLTGVQLIKRTTKFEDGSTVYTYIKEDCNNMIFVIERENSDGTTTKTTITTDTPSRGDPGNPDTPTPTPTPGHPAKNEQAEKANAGPRVDQQPLDESKTPATTLEQDQKPVQQAHEQVSSGDTAGSQAEKEKQAAVDNSAQTKQNNQESTAHADDTAAERANAFENGDF